RRYHVHHHPRRLLHRRHLQRHGGRPPHGHRHRRRQDQQRHPDRQPRAAAPPGPHTGRGGDPPRRLSDLHRPGARRLRQLARRRDRQHHVHDQPQRLLHRRHLHLTPASATITPRGSQAYTAQGRDRYDNPLGDITSSTTFTISPDGSCVAAICTVTSPGPHTVTGTAVGATGTASLQVNAAAL